MRAFRRRWPSDGQVSGRAFARGICEPHTPTVTARWEKPGRAKGAIKDGPRRTTSRRKRLVEYRWSKTTRRKPLPETAHRGPRQFPLGMALIRIGAPWPRENGNGFTIMLELVQDATSTATCWSTTRRRHHRDPRHP